jgi:hypothetical protein
MDTELTPLGNNFDDDTIHMMYGVYKRECQKRGIQFMGWGDWLRADCPVWNKKEN